MNRPLFLATFAGGVLAGSAAVGQVVVPTFAAVCDDNDFVDKHKLATFLLDAKPVSRTLEDWATAHPDPAFPVGPRERVLIDPDICLANRAGAACKPTDADNLAEIQQAVTHLLTNYDLAFKNESGVDTPFAYFANPAARLTCLRRNAEPGDSVPAPTFTYTFPIRIRASTEGLNFDRKEPSFSIVQGATVAISDDEVNDKKVEKWSVVAGFALPPLISETKQSLYLVPYVGSTRDFSRVTGKPDTTTADSLFGGVLVDYRLRRMVGQTALTHYFTLTPEYRKSDSDSDTSNLWTVTGTWMPIVNGVANNYTPFVVGKSIASWRLIFDLRAVHGWFTDVGNLAAPYNRDFTRAGSQFGFAIKSDNPRWPLDLVVTETVLPSLGNGKDLDYFSSRLSLGLDPSRIFTIDLTYANGRRSDILAEEEQWKIGFGAKY